MSGRGGGNAAGGRPLAAPAFPLSPEDAPCAESLCLGEQFLKEPPRPVMVALALRCLPKGAVRDGAAPLVADPIEQQRALLDQRDLEHATLEDAHLEQASLWRAHLEQAKLWGTNLEQATLREASLEGATLDPNTVWPAGFS